MAKQTPISRQRLLIKPTELATIISALQHWQRCESAQARRARPLTWGGQQFDAITDPEIDAVLNYLMEVQS